MKSTEKKNSDVLCEVRNTMGDGVAFVNRRCNKNDLSPSIKDVKEAREDGVKKFAHFLIDQARDGVIHISDLPDYVCEFLREKENDDNCDC